MSEMQSKNWCSQAADRYGNRKSNWCSLLYLRILEAGISEIMMVDYVLLVGLRIQFVKENLTFTGYGSPMAYLRGGRYYGEIRQISV